MQRKAILVLGLVLAVGCNQPEPGLMESTKANSGPDFDGDGKPSDIHWARPFDFPIRVEVSPRLPADYFGHLVRAIDEVNRAAGHMLLSYPVTADSRYATKVEVGGSFPKRRTIFVYGDQGTDPSKATTTYYYQDDGRLEATTIQLPETVADWVLRYDITLHEVLHSIGFDHDPREESVMYPKMVRVKQHITANDKALIREMYGKD